MVAFAGQADRVHEGMLVYSDFEDRAGATAEIRDVLGAEVLQGCWSDSLLAPHIFRD